MHGQRNIKAERYWKNMAIFRLLLQSRDKICVSKRPFLVAVTENIWTLEGVIIGWRKLRNTDLPLHCSPDIMLIRARMMRWAGRVARMAAMRNAWSFFFHVTYPAVLYSSLYSNLS